MSRFPDRQRRIALANTLLDGVGPQEARDDPNQLRGPPLALAAALCYDGPNISRSNQIHIPRPQRGQEVPGGDVAILFSRFVGAVVERGV